MILRPMLMAMRTNATTLSALKTGRPQRRDSNKLKPFIEKATAKAIYATAEKYFGGPKSESMLNKRNTVAQMMYQRLCGDLSVSGMVFSGRA
jgi:hypothetical protein